MAAFSTLTTLAALATFSTLTTLAALAALATLATLAAITAVATGSPVTGGPLVALVNRGHRRPFRGGWITGGGGSAARYNDRTGEHRRVADQPETLHAVTPGSCACPAIGGMRVART